MLVRIAFVALVVSVATCSTSDAAEPDLRALALQIEKGTSAAKIKALQEAGAIGPKAKALLRPIALAMLSRDKEVKSAAANAMRKIDDNVEAVALKLLLQFDDVNIEDMAKQGKDVIDPLLPLILYNYEKLIEPRVPSDEQFRKAQMLLNCIFVHTPDDPATNLVILKAMKSNHVRLQHTGVVGSQFIKDGKKGLNDVYRIAKICPNEGVRVDAVVAITSIIENMRRHSHVVAAVVGMPATLPNFIEDTMRQKALKELRELRLDKSEAVRTAVGKALDTLEQP